MKQKSELSKFYGHPCKCGWSVVFLELPTKKQEWEPCEKCGREYALIVCEKTRVFGQVKQ